MPSPSPWRSIPSDGDVVGVLELNAGEADKIGLKRGDKVVYPGLAKASSVLRSARLHHG